MRFQQQRGLLGADRAELQSSQTVGELLVESETLNRPILGEMREPGLVTKHRTAKALDVERAVAVVMAVAEHDPLGCAELGERIQALGRLHRVDQRARVQGKAAVDRVVDAFVKSAPVKQPR